MSGKIDSLYFSGVGNFPVRVVLKGVTDPCGNGGSAFAFIDDEKLVASNNYNVFVAALMLAKAQNSTINMVVTPKPDDPGHCRLVEFNITS